MSEKTLTETKWFLNLHMQWKMYPYFLENLPEPYIGPESRSDIYQLQGAADYVLVATGTAPSTDQKMHSLITSSLILALLRLVLQSLAHPKRTQRAGSYTHTRLGECLQTHVGPESKLVWDNLMNEGKNVLISDPKDIAPN